jgi:hypothetical protein
MVDGRQASNASATDPKLPVTRTSASLFLPIVAAASALVGWAAARLLVPDRIGLGLVFFGGLAFLLLGFGFRRRRR